MALSGFEYVKNGWELLEGTRTEQFDTILSILGIDFCHFWVSTLGSRDPIRLF